MRDYGDVPLDLDWSRFFQAVEDRAVEVLRHPLALFLGGDHSVTIPLMRALDRVVDGSFGVLHFDAHSDLFDVYEGHRWSHACTERRALELPGLAPQHLVFVGLRSFCLEEWDFLKAHPEITTYTARECYRQGSEAIAEPAAQEGAQAPAEQADHREVDPELAVGEPVHPDHVDREEECRAVAVEGVKGGGGGQMAEGMPPPHEAEDLANG